MILPTWKFGASKSFKEAIFETSNPLNLISHKIREAEKFLNFHTVSVFMITLWLQLIQNQKLLIELGKFPSEK